MAHLLFVWSLWCLVVLAVSAGINQHPISTLVFIFDANLKTLSVVRIFSQHDNADKIQNASRRGRIFTHTIKLFDRFPVAITYPNAEHEYALSNSILAHFSISQTMMERAS